MPDSTENQVNFDDPHYSRILPDPKICQTLPIGEIHSFATCLVEFPITCSHAMSYGKGYLCRHPNWRKFVKP